MIGLSDQAICLAAAQASAWRSAGAWATVSENEEVLPLSPLNTE